MWPARGVAELRAGFHDLHHVLRSAREADGIWCGGHVIRLAVTVILAHGGVVADRWAEQGLQMRDGARDVGGGWRD